MSEANWEFQINLRILVFVVGGFGFFFIWAKSLFGCDLLLSVILLATGVGFLRSLCLTHFCSQYLSKECLIAVLVYFFSLFGIISFRPFLCLCCSVACMFSSGLYSDFF